MDREGEFVIDWAVTCQFLRKRLVAELPGVERATIDDLVQEALIRLLRAVRRGEVDNLEALSTVIARRTAIDHLRGAWRRFFEQPGEEGLDPPDPATLDPASSEPPVEMIAFCTLEYFRSTESPCLDLARHYFAGRDWTVVANLTGKSQVAIRQQWSRCVKALRDAVRSNKNPLWSWA
jgi:DNA-directed RNA polymerase specialized sigma24 family protein